MKEIKFRARNVVAPACWIYGYFVVEKDCCYIINDDGKFEVIAGTECQYICLKDDNDKEEYEGDILKIVWVGETYIETIEFKDGAFVAGDFSLGKEKRGDTTFAVIGNKHENPELLK